jgi:type 1 glutamine amidotransferase
MGNAQAVVLSLAARRVAYFPPRFPDSILPTSFFMKRSSFLLFPVAILGAILLLPNGRPPARAEESGGAGTKPLKVLLVIGGCCHDYATQRQILKAGIEQRLNAVVDLAYTPDKSTKATFAEYQNANWADGYDVVVHDECSADVKDLPTVNRILDAHRNGVPAVNLHCAMHCYRTAANVGKPVQKNTDESLWFDYLGLQSSGHGAQKPITLTFCEKNHPILKGLSEWTTINEELYNNIQVYDAAVPLMKGSQGDGKEPIVAWTHEYGPKKTRVFSTTLGHNNETVSDDRYLDLVTRGLLWACNKLNADGTPKAGFAAAKK